MSRAVTRRSIGRPRPALDFQDLLDAGNLHRFRAVERRHLAAGHRRAGDDGILHAGQPHVGTIMSLARRDVVEIDDTDLALAKVTEILGVLELEAFDARHQLLCGIGSQFAKAWKNGKTRPKWKSPLTSKRAILCELPVQLTNSHKI